MRFRLLCACVLACLAAIAGCRCAPETGEVDSFAFARCAQLDPPEERSVRLGNLELAIQGRVLTVKPKDELRLSAFAGPVGAALSRSDLGLLSAARAELLVYLGDLGDTQELASANLVALYALRVPTLFVPGGADRAGVIEAAFAELDDDASQYLISAAGLRELRVFDERFAILPGAALGRYAIDEAGCGFERADLEELEEALDDTASKKVRTWLLAWNAPAGWGLTGGAGGSELGSEDLRKLAADLGARGGLFAFPEAQAFVPVTDAARGGLAMVVPRLGRTGSLRADGAHLPRGLATLRLTPSQGLLAGP